VIPYAIRAIRLPRLRPLGSGRASSRLRCRDDATGKIVEIDCFNREGWRLDDWSPGVFRKLRRRRLIFSHDGSPYRISREGLAAVRAQLDNR
jgi:uncharacterized protein YjhX (UPF0386 family)